ncbi:sulfurtransferase complex subunit TusD [Candidatus Erwinia haradaeae]|uniref:Sulfurtransferase TusD n=1 Tax=Candidatus Erwinia haradaeae TaxID=1922217 RepID=A0A451D9L6_9GAMM|nr:sulfurtransferase complex subunit TusD [Candidatus Erwinia haradaeae]VFP83011.1 Sulfurtransferase TusD [Candidatus Erwinia haradaeae]
MRFCIIVTGPSYGTQQASNAWLFANALVATQHVLESVFFYREGVLNANKFNTPANDEVNLTRLWQSLHHNYGVKLNLCVSAALRRGIYDHKESCNMHFTSSNLAIGFQLTGLSELATATLTSDRIVQF